MVGHMDGRGHLLALVEGESAASLPSKTMRIFQRISLVGIGDTHLTLSVTSPKLMEK